LIVAVVAVLAAGAPAAHASAGDAQICAQASGDDAIAACARVIGSGAYQGPIWPCARRSLMLVFSSADPVGVVDAAQVHNSIGSDFRAAGGQCQP